MANRVFHPPASRWARSLALLPVLAISCAAPGDVAISDEPYDPDDTPVVAARAEALELEKYLNEDQQKILEIGSDIVGAYTGVKSAFDTVKNIASLLGLGADEGPTIEQIILDKVNQIIVQLNAMQVAQTGAELSQLVRDTGYTLTQATSASKTARDWVAFNNQPYPQAVAQPAILASRHAVEALATTPGYFQRIHSEAGNNGESTVVEQRVLPVGEWKQVIAKRPPVTGGNQFEWRIGLPALMQAIGAHLNVLSATYPNHIPERKFTAELMGYRARLIELRNQIDSNISCGFALWAVKHTDIKQRYFQLRAICVDPFTGTNVTIAKTGKFDFFTKLTDCPSGFSVGGVGGLARKNCTDLWKWSTPRSLNTSDDFYYDQYGIARSVKAKFNELAGSTFPFSELAQFGLDDARAKLKMKLGLFEVRRMIDSLYAVANNSRRLDADGYIRSAMPNRCLAVTSDKPGSYAVNAECVPSSNLGVFLQAWAHDPISGNIRNWWNNCLSVPSASPGNTRIGTSVWVWGCDYMPSQAQRWSYDPESHMVRNALGRTLDVQWANTAAGTPIWTWDENGGIAQRWGYGPPLTGTVLPPGPVMPIPGI